MKHARRGYAFSRRSLLAGSAGALISLPARRPLAGSAQDPEVPLARTLTFRPQHGPVRTPPNPDMTISTLYNIEAVPLWVRLIYLAGGIAYPVDGAAIAATSAVHDGFTPVDASGKPNDALWQRVSFNHNGDDSSQEAPPARPVHTLDVPVRSAPVMGFSDWMKMPPMPRSDGRAGALVLVRTHSSNGLRNASAAFQVVSGSDLRRDFAAFRSPGDGTVPPWPFDATRDSLTASYGLQYIAANPGATVVAMGDSTMQPPYSVPYGLRACALVSTPGRPVSYLSEAGLGRFPTDYLPSGLLDIGVLKPQVALIQAFGEYDMTVHAPDHFLKLATSVADYAKQHACVPIFSTGSPDSEITPELEDARLFVNGRLRAMRDQGYELLDLDLLWSDQRSATHWKPGFANDRWHPSDLATRVAAEALAPMLRRILAIPT